MANETIASAVRRGRQIRPAELEAARQTVQLCSGLSRLELARTICEHWDWVTASGSHKVTACLKVLEEWEQQGLIRLPGKRNMTRWNSDQASGAVATRRTDPRTPLVGRLSEVGSVWLEPVQDQGTGRLWNEYVDRYHYLGYRQPVGCFLRYFIQSASGLLGCVLVAGAAKSMRRRDDWIGWDRQCRWENLPWVINNTRLLIFPWVRLHQLGSHVLGQLTGRVGADWRQRWGYAPLLMETFVDPVKFRGTCYQAAGWIELGRTTGRGLARVGAVYRSTPKIIYVKALAEDVRERLCGDPLPGRGEL